MKKITFKLLIAALFLFALPAEAQSFQKGQTDINIGVGLGNTFIDGSYRNYLPPLSISAEIGITNDVSLGGYFGIAGASSTYYYYDNGNPHWNNGNGYYYTDTYRWTYYIVGLRAAYHFGRFIQIDKLDCYAGLMLAGDFVHESYTTDSPYPDHVYTHTGSSGLIASIYVGARYRFNNHIGAFAELGYGISVLTVGVNFKL
jgi:hypothetical protein